MVWLGTDWDVEIKKGIERNREEARNRRVSDHDQPIFLGKTATNFISIYPWFHDGGQIRVLPFKMICSACLVTSDCAEILHEWDAWNGGIPACLNFNIRQLVWVYSSFNQ